jgi:hypothetical protein
VFWFTDQLCDVPFIQVALGQILPEHLQEYSKKILTGGLIHADETAVNLQKVKAMYGYL